VKTQSRRAQAVRQVSNKLVPTMKRSTIAKRKRAAKSIEALTPSERRVLDELLKGKSARDIGRALGNSPFTISNHTRRIFAAFGTNSRSEILAMFVVPLEEL
jgi:DNA-binding CsgD family transcriptional regulator